MDAMNLMHKKHRKKKCGRKTCKNGFRKRSCRCRKRARR